MRDWIEVRGIRIAKLPPPNLNFSRLGVKFWCGPAATKVSELKVDQGLQGRLSCRRSLGLCLTGARFSTLCY